MVLKIVIIVAVAVVDEDSGGYGWRIIRRRKNRLEIGQSQEGNTNCGSLSGGKVINNVSTINSKSVRHRHSTDKRLGIWEVRQGNDMFYKIIYHLGAQREKLREIGGSPFLTMALTD